MSFGMAADRGPDRGFAAAGAVTPTPAESPGERAQPTLSLSAAALAGTESAELSTEHAAAQAGAGILHRFLEAGTVGEALEALFGTIPTQPKSEIAKELNRQVALLDRAVSRQLNVILHHSAFQRLEASWCGIKYLHDCAVVEADAKVIVKVLNVSRRELERDFERAAEFDRSQLFQKVYEHEFGTPGGIPFGALIADFDIRPFSSPDYPHDDLSVLRSMSQIAGAAFCPLIAAAHPSMFGLDDFADLNYQLNHAATFEHLDYLKWRSLRDSDDARFLGLVLPRVLMRAPYTDNLSRVDRFCFQEDVVGADRSKYLWGSAAYAFGGVLIRAFVSAGWLADIRGVRRDEASGGVVPGLVQADFRTDSSGIAPRSSTEISVSDELERQLSDLGFIPLCHCPDTPLAAFYSTPSIQKPKKYDRASATTNARISSLLQHIFCASRFAHYIKVMGRDKIGQFSDASQLESELQKWIVRYVTADNEATRAVKARFPLREATVSIRTKPDKPGAFECVMHLVPHYELDELAASIRLDTELAPPRGN